MHPLFFEENQQFDQLNTLLNKNKYSKVFVLTDENSNQFCLTILLQNIETSIEIEIIEIENGEENKTIETTVQLWNTLVELGADRKSLLINLGGGVITDIGGFIASTFKRGIAYINIPTTLLGMVDAAVGGKNGIDLGHLKNQIGTISQPEAVIINPIFLETLPSRQLKSGLAEMLKHGLIYNKEHWTQLKNLKNIHFEDLSQLIKDSVAIKYEIVSNDLTENGIRKALNFGHTFGHALEGYFLETKKKTLLHGEAIAIGMIWESHFSLQQKLISKAEFDEIFFIITEYFHLVAISEIDFEAILGLMLHDKKNEAGKINFVLLNGIGNHSIDCTVSREELDTTFNYYKNLEKN